MPAARRPLSIAVVALVGGDALAATVGRLRCENAELLIVTGDDPSIGALPDCTVIDGRGLNVPERRQRAIERATGEVVALLEDTSVPGPNWCAALREAFADPEVAAAGGP